MNGTTHRNLAARMGRWSADHWKTATFGWLAFVLVAFALGAAGTVSIDPNTACLLYTSPSPRDGLLSRMPSSA